MVCHPLTEAARSWQMRTPKRLCVTLLRELPGRKKQKVREREKTERDEGRERKKEGTNKRTRIERKKERKEGRKEGRKEK